jgi:multidrug efflux pump subunit AcrB
MNIWLPEGSSLRKTSEICGRVEAVIKKYADYKDKTGKTESRLENMVSFIGQGAPRIKLSYMVEHPKSNYAEILINTTSSEVLDDYMAKVETECRENIPGARVTARRIGMGPPVRYPIMIRILGSDYSMLKKYADIVKDILKKEEGVYNVHDSWGNLGYQLDIIPDQEKCIAAGVTRKSIAQTLNAYYSGHYLTTFREGDHLIPVYLRLPPEQRQNIPNQDALYVEGKSGKVPLSSVAKLDITRQPSRIERFNKRRNMQVQSSTRRGYLANPIINKIMPKLKKLRKQLPTGYDIEIGGITEKSKEATGHISRAMMISIFLIILTLVIYFNTISKTIIVLITLPLALIGAFMGLWIMNQPLGFFAQLGLLALFGIVVNGAIVLFDFIGMLVVDKRKDSQTAVEGKSYHGISEESFTECVIAGCTLRIRPIFMTSLTTIGGLMPLMFNGGPLFSPLATVLIFGLAFSTILTLYVIPTVYYFFARKFKIKLIDEFPANPE